MIISFGRRYIFVHVPKTGGTSLALALEDRAMSDDLMLGDTPKAKKRRRRLKDVEASGRLWKHSRIADVYGLVTQQEIEDFFVFTLVRNPWDRLVSYYHWLQTQNFAQPVVSLAKELDFSEFLKRPQVSRGFQAASYASYVSDNAGRDRCNLYIRFEHLEADLAPLEDHLGFKLGPLQRKNVSNRDRDYRRYYTDADRDLVARICAEDIARFNYEF